VANKFGHGDADAVRTISCRIGTLERMHVAEAGCDGALDRNMRALGHGSRKWRDSVCVVSRASESVFVCV